MDVVKIAKWFESKKIEKIWFLIFYSVFFALVVNTLIRVSLYFTDIYIFNDIPKPINNISLVIQFTVFAGLGFYFANSGWKEIQKSDLNN